MKRDDKIKRCKKCGSVMIKNRNNKWYCKDCEGINIEDVKRWHDYS